MLVNLFWVVLGGLDTWFMMDAITFTELFSHKEKKHSSLTSLVRTLQSACIFGVLVKPVDFQDTGLRQTFQIKEYYVILGFKYPVCIFCVIVKIVDFVKNQV